MAGDSRDQAGHSSVRHSGSDIHQDLYPELAYLVVQQQVEAGGSHPQHLTQDDVLWSWSMLVVGIPHSVIFKSSMLTLSMSLREVC